MPRDAGRLTEPMGAPDLVMLTVKEAHDLTNLPLRTIYRLVEDGQIASRRIGRTIYIRRASLAGWIMDDHEIGGSSWQEQDGANADRVRSISGRRTGYGVPV